MKVLGRPAVRDEECSLLKVHDPQVAPAAREEGRRQPQAVHLRGPQPGARPRSRKGGQRSSSAHQARIGAVDKVTCPVGNRVQQVGNMCFGHQVVLHQAAQHSLRGRQHPILCAYRPPVRLMLLGCAGTWFTKGSCTLSNW